MRQMPGERVNGLPETIGGYLYQGRTALALLNARIMADRAARGVRETVEPKRRRDTELARKRRRKAKAG